MKRYLFSLMLLPLIAGCGGGGGATVSANHTAQVTLTTAGTPSDSLVGLVDVVLNLPAGVTVRTTAAQEVSGSVPGVITLAPALAASTSPPLLTSLYLPGTPGKLKIKLLSTTGVQLGVPLVTVTCDIPAGSSVLPADFSITPNILPTGVFDLLAADLPSVQAQFSAVIN